MSKNLDTLFHIDESCDPYDGLVTKFNNAIDQQGELLEEMGSRVAFLRLAVGEIIGQEGVYDNDYFNTRFVDLNDLTPYEKVVKGDIDDLKQTVEHLIRHYSM